MITVNTLAWKEEKKRTVFKMEPVAQYPVKSVENVPAADSHETEPLAPHVSTMGIPIATTTFWSSNIFDCLDDVNSAIEVTFCGPCQLSRQYNVITNGSRDIDALSLFGQFAGNILSAMLHIPIGMGSVLLNYHVRTRLRQRYMLEGSAVSDALFSAFCTSCALCQQYREMSQRGEWTSGCCIDQPYQKFPPPSVTVMSAV